MLTKEEILKAVVADYKDDLDFIEALNSLTYHRKVQLKRNNLTNHNYADKQEDSF